MNPPDTTASVDRVRIGLQVRDLSVSVEFYGRLFKSKPTERTETRALFELESPPLRLELYTGRTRDFREHLELGCLFLNKWAFGDLLSRCMYERFLSDQRRIFDDLRRGRPITEIRLADPDETPWFFRVEEPLKKTVLQSAADSVEATPEGRTVPSPPPPAFSTSWFRHAAEGPVSGVPHPDNALSSVALTEVVNMDGADRFLPPLLKDVLRALRPGGILKLDGLSSDSPLKGPLPYDWSLTTRARLIPTHSQVLSLMKEAGFAQVRLAYLSSPHGSESEETAFRSFKATGEKPGDCAEERTRTVVYLGPFQFVEDDFGNRFVKGVPTKVNTRDWQHLIRGNHSLAFNFFDEAYSEFVIRSESTSQNP
jgi:hypothetical protein